MTLEQLCARLKIYDCKMGELQARWQNDPPLARNEPEWWNEVTLAILDALITHGVDAWDGDAVGCVTNIIYAISTKAERVENG